VLRVDQSAGDDRDFLRDSLVGWDGLVDDDGKPVPFSQGTRDALIGLSFVQDALGRAVMEAMRGDKWVKTQV
jgi:hypothetical protein